jgi:hypothetical protein
MTVLLETLGAQYTQALMAKSRGFFAQGGLQARKIWNSAVGCT